MRLFTSLPKAVLLSQHRRLREAEISRTLKPALKAADMRVDQSCNFFNRFESTSKGGMISALHISEVEANHKLSNLKFHKMATLVRYFPASHLLLMPELLSPIFATTPDSPNSVSPHLNNLHLKISLEDLNLIFELLKSLLHAKKLLKEKPSREAAIPGTYLLDDQQVSEAELAKIKRADADRIFEISTLSKESSMSIQWYISECSQEELAALADKVKLRLPELIVHKFGSFVIQRLLIHFDQAYAMVEHFCMLKFDDLIKNEYSSRVIQLLIEKSKSFCNFSLSIFKRNIEKAIGTSSACHLLVACLKNCGDSNDGSFILDQFKKGHLELEISFSIESFFHIY